MNTDDNKDLVRRFVDEIFVAGRVEAIDELVAPDFVSHTWGFTEDGRNKLRAATERVHGTLKDVEFTIDELVAEGDLVVARLTSSATPIGEFMGVPAGGKRYTIGEMHMFRIRDGQVSEHWLQHDALGLMRQLGAIPG
ncbi:MAG: ester cyclase [Candidatus Limnocylindria bacterium]